MQRQSDHEPEPETDETRELSDDELDDVAGGSAMSSDKFGLGA